MAEVTSGTDLTGIILDEAEAGALARLLQLRRLGHLPAESVMEALAELTEAMGATDMGPHLGGKW